MKKKSKLIVVSIILNLFLLFSFWYFVQSKKDGMITGNYFNGNLKFRHSYKDGKKHGICEKYDKNGSLIWKGHYEDGILLTEEFFKGNLPERKKLYGEEGNLEIDVSYGKGAKTYYGSGELSSEAMHGDGASSVMKTYYKDGGLQSEIEVLGEGIQNIRQYDRGGDLISDNQLSLEEYNLEEFNVEMQQAFEQMEQIRQQKLKQYGVEE